MVKKELLRLIVGVETKQRMERIAYAMDKRGLPPINEKF
jgi:phosphopantetheine adenylyltransferase